MDRWKAEPGRGREKRKIKERRSEKRKSQKKEDADARKGRKVAKHCVFSMCCGSGGSKSRFAKAAGAETSGEMRNEKLHAVVARSRFWSEKVQNTWVSEHFWKLRCQKSAARSTFRSQNVQSTPFSDHFWKLRCRKSARRCGAKHISKWKCTKHYMFAPLLEVQMSFCVAGAKDCAPRQKWAKREGFVAFPEAMAGVGDLKRIFKDAFSVEDMFMRDVRRSGRWFPERGCILEYQMCRFAKMILRDRWCSTSYDLDWPGINFFRGRRSTLDRWTGKIAKHIGTRLSALHSTFHFWRKSRRILSFLMSSISKNEDVSQNCFVSDVVMFKH